MRKFTRVVNSFCRMIAVVAILGAVLVAPTQALGSGKTRMQSEDSRLTVRLPRPHLSELNSAVGIDHFSHRLTALPRGSILGHAAIVFAGSRAVVPSVALVGGGEPMPNSFYLGMMEPAADRLPLGAIASDRPVVAPRSLIAVPVPDAWAMILVGVGLVGIRLRRKSRLASARHFT